MSVFDPAIAEAFDRLPPHSLEAERCLLASLMLCGSDRSGKALVARVRGMVDREAFYQSDHQAIYDVLCALYDGGKAVDAVILREELIRRQMFEDVGGEHHLYQILNAVPNYAHAEHYAGIVREKSILRGLISLSNEALRNVYAPRDDDAAERLCQDFAAKASKLARAGTASNVHRLSDLAASVYERNMEGKPLRVPTGLRDLDRLTGGLRKGGKVIVGAKPGMGKSQLVKQIGLNLARSGTKFGVVSVEEPGEKIAENALSNLTGVINNRIAFNTLNEIEWRKLADGVAATQKLPFFVVDSARRLSKLIAAIHTLVCEYGCEVVAVDHLHIIEAELSGRETRERQIAHVSAELKWVWKELGVCGIEAAQLNRGSGRERPGLDSLRDSGSLEQDGDMILLLHREDYYRKPGEHMDGVLECIVAKNKDGAPGTVPLKFDPARQSITDHNVEEVPWHSAPAPRAPRHAVQEIEL